MKSPIKEAVKGIMSISPFGGLASQTIHVSVLSHVFVSGSPTFLGLGEHFTRHGLSPTGDVGYIVLNQPDNISNYASASGSTLNPIIPYTSSIAGDGIYKPRSNNITVAGNSFAANATQNVTITCNLYEPLISPFNNLIDLNSG